MKPFSDSEVFNRIDLLEEQVNKLEQINSALDQRVRELELKLWHMEHKEGVEKKIRWLERENKK